MGRNSESADRKRLLDPNGPRSVFGILCKPFKRMAGTTRLELATSAVTGQRSNQLNYVPTRQINKLRNNQSYRSSFSENAKALSTLSRGGASAFTTGRNDLLRKSHSTTSIRKLG